MTRGESRYVYAILPDGDRFPAGLTGFGEAPVEPVRYGALAAATSVVEPGDIGPRPEDVMIHESTVEALHRAGPLLPVRFGTILEGTGDVERVLAKQYDILASDLKRLGDKVEFGLTVLWDEPPLDEGAMPEEAPSAAGPGGRYLQARVAEYRREAAARARAEEMAEILDAVLRPHSIEQRRTIHSSGRMAVRAAYLLHPDHMRAFQLAFDEIRQELRGVQCLLSGPWPPYSFVTPSDGRPASTNGPGAPDRSAPSDGPEPTI
jgi:hypothetical protein